MEAIVTIASVPAIVAVTNLLKTLGMTGRWATLSAVCLGLMLTALSRVLDPATWGMISDGLILGLSAAGLYDVAGQVGGSSYTPQRAEQ